MFSCMSRKSLLENYSIRLNQWVTCSHSSSFSVNFHFLKKMLIFREREIEIFIQILIFRVNIMHTLKPPSFRDSNSFQFMCQNKQHCGFGAFNSTCRTCTKLKHFLKFSVTTVCFNTHTHTHTFICRNDCTSTMSFIKENHSTQLIFCFLSSSPFTLKQTAGNYFFVLSRALFCRN